MPKYKKTLNLSISIACFFFILSLCVVISLVNYSALYKALFERYNVYLEDILHHIEYNIDTDDLYECIQTNQKSENYEKVQQLMNNMLDTGSVHYLYIITPLNVSETHTCLTVMTGMTKDEIENHYDEQNFLGDVFDDFPPKLVQQFVDAMEKPGEITYEIDKQITIWGMDYTGMLPLTTSSGKTFSVLAADISVEYIYKTLLRHFLINIILIIGIGLFFFIAFILWSKRNITQPIKQLEKSVVEFARTSHNQNDPDLLSYTPPVIHTDNEMKALSDAITLMSDDIKAYAKNILDAENKISDLKQSASKLGMLVYQDALTHVKNKAAYDRSSNVINLKIQKKRAEFALVMIDLNSLKKINDEYGHEKGNSYITGAASAICTIYAHSPVYRIGGDEFVVILENTDYKFRNELFEALSTTVEGYSMRTDCEPWQKISLAAGMSVFIPGTDSNIDSVFKRADKLMYENKQHMKAELEEIR